VTIADFSDVRYGSLAILLLVLALISGCQGGGTEDDGTMEAAVEERDSLSILADEVDDAFLQSITETGPQQDAAGQAFASAGQLIVEVLERERPDGGWTREDLDAALRQRRLPVEIGEVGSLEQPWLLRVPHPLRPASVGRILLVYPDEVHLVGLPEDPFRQDYETATWVGSNGIVLGVAGWVRSRAGLQPTVWTFHLPMSSEDEDWLWDTLPVGNTTALSDGGAAAVGFVGADGHAAPRIRVTEAVLPNYLFDECANCPHLQADLTFRYAEGRYVLSSENPRRTPYAAFVQFVEALLAHDEENAYALAEDRMVVELAKDFAFDRYPRRGRWRIAPGSTATGLDQIYLRGEEGAYRILMSVRGSNFIVSSISPAEFIID
jgi:hypothetical protein